MRKQPPWSSCSRPGSEIQQAFWRPRELRASLMSRLAAGKIWLATCSCTEASPIDSRRETSKGRRCGGDENQLHRWTCIQTDFAERT